MTCCEHCDATVSDHIRIISWAYGQWSRYCSTDCLSAAKEERRLFAKRRHRFVDKEPTSMIPCMTKIVIDAAMLFAVGNVHGLYRRYR